ncbi:DNA repair protein XRCC2-like protein [Zostera marina]|uniref:DNA repair protein XRCC2-like protein n=1 Tax=Zostera marina TaxID=29655 RepID=A0A0K9PG93_ZOSMR|nr:DNA repair protein XRCC2-like protein [Zostera marina]
MENPMLWIKHDETGHEYLDRLAVNHPAFLLPPLHRVPLCAGNVLEIIGPSPSAKSEVLLQASIYCVLPKLHFGGLERLVMYLDLDCRFDVSRFAQCLKTRLMQTHQHDEGFYNDELFQTCMSRFLYMRCHDSIEFLTSLKTIQSEIPKIKELHGISVHFLMIDSIGAYFWMDRFHGPHHFKDIKRENMSLQSIMENVSREIRKILQVHPMLVLATKATILGLETSTSEEKRHGRCSFNDVTSSNVSNRDAEKHSHKEYMPSSWQLFVTHRIFLRISDEKSDDRKDENYPIYTSKWIMPLLHFSDRFRVGDDGIVLL